MDKEHTKIAEWLIGNDTGESSENIAFEFLGEDERDKSEYPHDPADFGRCLRLIVIEPRCRDSVSTLGIRYKEWKALNENWELIAECMAGEVGINWEKGRRAPITYKLMQDILSAIKA